MDEPLPSSGRPRSVSAPGALPKGTILDGKYELNGVLGAGGTGIVYDALRLVDGASLALKVMHAHLAGDKQIRGRFQREAAILKRLEDAHICPILELSEMPTADGGESLLYMALTKLEGPTFEHVLETERPIDVMRALDVMLEICAALRAAHGQGVIHRDLKPANVILERGKKAVVVDFGMSKIVTGGGMGTTNLTTHNMVFGTPEYMSPEQARGDELDARCDVYAAGVILYEILTGGPPFTGASPLNVLTEHLTGVLDPPSKRAVPGRVTPALDAVVIHALARDRDQRYPSASALSAAIMHARAMPNDVASLNPAAFATSPAGTDAFAVTMPALGGFGSAPPSAINSDRGVVKLDPHANSDTLLASSPPAPLRRPSSKPSLRPHSPSKSGPPSAATSPAESTAESAGMWIVLWALAAVASIGIGIYFALR